MPDTDKISKKKQINEEENSNNLDTHPSSNSQENENKVPELIKYDQDHSGKKSEISFVNSRHGSLSSNQKEEELIIRGEINKTNINKEDIKKKEEINKKQKNKDEFNKIKINQNIKHQIAINNYQDKKNMKF